MNIPNISLVTSSEKSTISVCTHLIYGESNFLIFEEITRKIQKLNSDVVEIDLLKCSYIDSKTISFILEIHQALKKKGRILRLVNVSDDISDLIKAISLDKIIQLN